jgi:hypothetical protein
MSHRSVTVRPAGLLPGRAVPQLASTPVRRSVHRRARVGFRA